MACLYTTRIKFKKVAIDGLQKHYIAAAPDSIQNTVNAIRLLEIFIIANMNALKLKMYLALLHSLTNNKDFLKNKFTKKQMDMSITWQLKNLPCNHSGQ